MRLQYESVRYLSVCDATDPNGINPELTFNPGSVSFSGLDMYANEILNQDPKMTERIQSSVTDELINAFQFSFEQEQEIEEEPLINWKHINDFELICDQIHGKFVETNNQKELDENVSEIVNVYNFTSQIEIGDHESDENVENLEVLVFNERSDSESISAELSESDEEEHLVIAGYQDKIIEVDRVSTQTFVINSNRASSELLHVSEEEVHIESDVVEVPAIDSIDLHPENFEEPAIDVPDDFQLKPKLEPMLIYIEKKKKKKKAKCCIIC
jgi:hypothetical protein